MVALFAMVFLLVSAPSVPRLWALGPPAGTPGIETIVHRFAEAWNRHDVAGLCALFHEDGVLISPSGKQVQGARGIQWYLLDEHPELFEDTTLRQSIDDVDFQGPGLALVEGRYELGVPLFLGIQKTTRGQFSLRLLLGDSGWRIAVATITR